jgi:hypothetical protein
MTKLLECEGAECLRIASVWNGFYLPSAVMFIGQKYEIFFKKSDQGCIDFFVKVDKILVKFQN